MLPPQFAGAIRNLALIFLVLAQSASFAINLDECHLDKLLSKSPQFVFPAREEIKVEEIGKQEFYLPESPLTDSYFVHDNRGNSYHFSLGEVSVGSIVPHSEQAPMRVTGIDSARRTIDVLWHDSTGTPRTETLKPGRGVNPKYVSYESIVCEVRIHRGNTSHLIYISLPETMSVNERLVYRAELAALVQHLPMSHIGLLKKIEVHTPYLLIFSFLYRVRVNPIDAIVHATSDEKEPFSSAVSA